MREIGASVEEMKEVYIYQIRCLTEIGCQVWNSSLTVKNKEHLEKIQKMSLKIILGQNYIRYENALKILRLDKLESRQNVLCRRFARSSEKSVKFSKWFIKATKFTRHGSKYILPKPRTTSYEKSPLMYLTP